MTDTSWSFDRQLRQRILPALARLDDLQHEWLRALAVYDTLVDQDLQFDLRQNSPWPSNLCEDNSALELGYTFGGPENCGLRYSYEPTTRPGVLQNRYSLFRQRIQKLQRLLGDDYDLQPLLRAAHIAVPRELMRQADTTVTIAAVHHYRQRPPRIKAYYSCDYADRPRHGRDIALSLVSLCNDDALREQTLDFFRCFRPQGSPRMVGLDIEAGQNPKTKIYKSGEGLSKPALARLIGLAGGQKAARQALQHFQDIFLDGARGPALLDLIALAPKSQGAPGLKIYIRPVDFYDDAEALTRLQDWYQWLGQKSDFDVVRQGLQAVAPLCFLSGTRGFFNYISVDLGKQGASKTSVYFTPQILLRHIADRHPQEFLRLRQS